MRIRWLYEYHDLLQDGLSEEELEEANFQDGDLALSDHEQEVNVYNVLGVSHKQVFPEFFWDGDALTRLPEMQDKLAEERVPRHLDIVREFLLSVNLWRDTKYGDNLWYVLKQLMNIGNESNGLARRKLLQFFFDEQEGQPLPAAMEVTFTSIPKVRGLCVACGCIRWLSHQWKETGWRVGSHCQARILTLQKCCRIIAHLYQEAQSSKPCLPIDWLQKAADSINQARTEATEAIASWKTE
jgi:hypothetical protein